VTLRAVAPQRRVGGEWEAQRMEEEQQEQEQQEQEQEDDVLLGTALGTGFAASMHAARSEVGAFRVEAAAER
jgi:hypothetical protein